MRDSRKGWLALLTLAAGFIAVCSAPAAPPLAGNWKVTAVSEGKEIVLALIKVEERDGKPAIKILGPEAVKDAPIENVTVADRSLRFTMMMRGTPFHMAVYAPKGEEKPKKLLGAVQPPGNAEPLIVERTDQTDIAEKDAERDSPGFNELERLAEEKGARKREEGVKALVKKHAGEPVVLAAAEMLVQIAIADGAATDKVGPLADQYLKAAAVYGREMELHAALQLARGLLAAGKDSPLTVEYARQAEKQLKPIDPLQKQEFVLKVLAQALRKAGKDDEAKALDARLAKLETQLDEEFEKHAIPFKLEARPRGKRTNERVALVELFTGAQCPPCVAADIAFDAVHKTYKSNEVVLLQYHLHIPGPDALTNADSEARGEYYRQDSTPAVYLDGKESDPRHPLGGGRAGGKESYDTLRKQLDGAIKKNVGASLWVATYRNGDKIDIEAEVSDLAKVGDRVRLRLVLVEEVVRYPARNGQRLHHCVVRAFPGGVNGFALLDNSVKKKATVNLADLKKSLNAYLDKAAKAQRFPDDNRPLDLKRLKVVAFVQDDRSKEVLQAAEANVPDPKK
ncbi:MAG TPA: hypothetical protein VH643_23195 [Gemmataceae bacterium]|jgi:hypothetical protein